jgi:TPP-dependent pyruvate/acetoin dehydrogenase alpha subunit
LTFSSSLFYIIARIILATKTGEPDLWSLYARMYLSRVFERAVKKLWEDAKISGEMHLGIGEEAVAAGVVAHLEDGDAMALDHRGTPPLILRGIEPRALLKEFLGKPDGLCEGRGGHMHLFSPAHLAATSGIVGSSAPAAVGFALAAHMLRPGKIAVAFFGEGAMNQGMLLESLNLAVVWALPVLFVCKENGWSITTRSDSVTGGDLLARAMAFGLEAAEVDGTDAEAVFASAGRIIESLRQGGRPWYLLAHCLRQEGHFLGDPASAPGKAPWRALKESGPPLIGALLAKTGVPLRERIQGLGRISRTVRQAVSDERETNSDPVLRLRANLKTDAKRLAEIEKAADDAVLEAVESALGEP